MTDFTFTERGPVEAGFSEVFRERLVPVLRRFEADRQALRRRTLRAMTVAGGGAVAAVALCLALGWEVAAFFAVALGAIGVFAARYYFEGRWRTGLSAEVLPVLCDFLGEMRHGEQRIDAATFARLGVVPAFSSAALEDPVTGQHNGLDWALTEARLSGKTRDSKGRNRNTTVFRGLLFQIAVMNPAPRIFFARDRGALLNQVSETLSGSRKGLTRVEFPDADFEAVYEVYSDDPQAAFAYVTPGLVAGLKRLAEAETAGKGYVACAIEGDWFYIALERKGNFLAIGSLFKPLPRIEDDLHEAIADLDLPRRVIDTLTRG